MNSRTDISEIVTIAVTDDCNRHKIIAKASDISLGIDRRMSSLLDVIENVSLQAVSK